MDELVQQNVLIEWFGSETNLEWQEAQIGKSIIDLDPKCALCKISLCARIEQSAHKELSCAILFQ
jgi:hypothetical protein